MLLNYCAEWDRLQKQARGESVTDSEKQYKKLKKIQGLVEKKYNAGLISQKQYDYYKNSIAEYEMK